MDGNICSEGYNYEKFILYLYMCAAYSDFVIDADEKDVIREKMLGFKLMRPEDFDRNYHKVLQDFRQHNDFETLQHVQQCCEELKLSEADRIRIYHDFNDIILADGKEEDSERINLFKFKKILGLRTEDVE